MADTCHTGIHSSCECLQQQSLLWCSNISRYFLFASALVILSNEFSALYHNPTANTSISNSINIMHYFAQHDPQGSRLLFILTSFRDVVIRQQTARAQQLSADQQGYMQASSVPAGDESHDPMNSIFPGSGNLSPAKTPIISMAAPSFGRHNSNPNVSPVNSFTAMKRTSSHPDTLFPTLDTPASRNNSLDTFFDLARVSSHSAASNDGNESHGDAEIDFESLWQWPTTTLGPAVTPGGSTGGGGSLVDVQGVSDSNVPLFGMASADFAGS
jgi:hypothetical protein